MSQFISLSEAEEMTERYRENMESILAPSYRSKGILPLSETFGRSVFEALLAKTNCASLRIYYGMDEDLKTHAIIVAVDAEDNDLLPESPTTESDIVERGNRCPDLCPKSSPLNS